MKNERNTAPREPITVTKTVHAWRVEWKTSRHPDEWRPFSTFKEYPSDTLGSYWEALKRPGVLDARIVERVTVTQKTERVVSAEELRGRI